MSNFISTTVHKMGESELSRDAGHQNFIIQHENAFAH